jgi:exopolyphosphatase / guanosine-5'-triphosphate,3'-diphosphate pyrophosphatase
MHGIIDVGSNTVRLVVPDGPRKKARIELGADIEAHGRIGEDKLAEAAAAVEEMCEAAHRAGVGRLEILVTAPGRQAENADELVARLEEAAGRSVRVLSPAEEARYAFVGAVAGRDPALGPFAVCDLGGASTELAVGAPPNGPTWVDSVDLGALRLTHRLKELGGRGRKAVAAARFEIADAFAHIDPPRAPAALVVGGTARALRSVVGATLDADRLAEAVELLLGRAPARLANEYDISRRRARLLLAGALILGEVQQRVGVPLEVVEGSVRRGALHQLAA